MKSGKDSGRTKVRRKIRKSATERPYRAFGIEQLERLFCRRGRDAVVVAAIRKELACRSTKRARALRRRLAPDRSVKPARKPTRPKAVILPTPNLAGNGAAPVGLDDRQVRAAHAPANARLLVSAGPGMGKTEVACARVAHLLQSGAEPSHVWIVSFTRTAVQEIRQRIRRLSSDHPGVDALRIATIDSTSWNLLQGFEPDTASRFGGYEANIEALTARLRQPDPDLVLFLAEVEHLLVDEAQDVVGARADLLLALMSCLPRTCGVTIFTDDAQAIYGFTDDSPADDEPPDNLPTRIRDGALPSFEEVELTRIYRTSRKQLQALFLEGRKLAAGAYRSPAKAHSLVRECVVRNSAGHLGNITEQALDGRSDTLVLFRTRAEVLEASSYLGTTSHRVRMSGTPLCIHPWLGMALWDFTGSRLSQSEFTTRWRERVRDTFPALDPEAMWGVLRRMARDGGGVRMADLRARLTGSVPLELTVPELGFHGPILGTIHASKGREAPIVHLMMPPEPREGAAGEARVLLVAASRPRDELHLGKGKALYGSRTISGRFYRKARLKFRARVELGRPNDLDVARQALRGIWTPESAAEAQAFLMAHAATVLPARLISDPEDDFRYGIWCDLAGGKTLTGHASESLNKELFQIAKALWPGERRRPPRELQHVRFHGACTLVPLPAEREVLVEPFDESGFLLAPTISALTTIPFFAY